MKKETYIILGLLIIFIVIFFSNSFFNIIEGNEEGGGAEGGGGGSVQSGGSSDTGAGSTTPQPQNDGSTSVSNSGNTGYFFQPQCLASVKVKSLWPPQDCPTDGWDDIRPGGKQRCYKCDPTDPKKYRASDSYCPGMLQNNGAGLCMGLVGDPPPDVCGPGKTWDVATLTCKDLTAAPTPESTPTPTPNAPEPTPNAPETKEKTSKSVYINFSRKISYV